MQSKCVVRNIFFKCLLLTVKYGRAIYSELLKQLLRKLGTRIKVYILLLFRLCMNYLLVTSGVLMCSGVRVTLGLFPHVHLTVISPYIH